MSGNAVESNLDPATVRGFGQEWKAFDQKPLSAQEHQQLFEKYFRVFRWDLINLRSHGFDMGCGSGRWARLLASRVGHLHCLDASAEALEVARSNLGEVKNVTFHLAGVGAPPLAKASLDFGISLGVLHHVPDTAAAIRSCVELLKPGAPLLLYLYYRFDTRPKWFRAIWQASDLVRKGVSSLPFRIRLPIAGVLATTVYWPLARLALALDTIGVDVSNVPLSFYKNSSFYTMRTDALDRFGTRLEQRFTRVEIEQMLKAAGCVDIRFSDETPFWCVCAVRAA